MLTLLTPTGCRPEAFSLCIKWMEKQSYRGAVEWIIVDDGSHPYTIWSSLNDRWLITKLHPTPKWSSGKNTQSRNLLVGLDVFQKTSDLKDKLIIIEDDDYYHPEYLEQMDKWLDTHDLVGEQETKYYNLSNNSYRQCNNVLHSSLCATGMKGEAIDMFEKVCQEHPEYIDIHLWGRFQGSKKLYKTDYVVGIKGLPGREGIGAGHKMQANRSGSVRLDSDYKILKEWIGEDYKWVKEVVNARVM